MRYLLDANAVVALLNDITSPIARRTRRHAPRDIGLPAIVLHELYYAEFKSRVGKNVARVDALQFPVLEFDQEDARHAGEVRAQLASKGTPIGPYDVLIARQARARKLTLVTHNTTEFVRVPDLKVEDWNRTVAGPCDPSNGSANATPDAVRSVDFSLQRVTSLRTTRTVSGGTITDDIGPFKRSQNLADSFLTSADTAEAQRPLR